MNNIPTIKNIVELAVTEDTGRGDITSEILISPNWDGKAYIQAKEPGILAGINVARDVFSWIDSKLTFKILIKDGYKVSPGQKVALLSGSVSSILKGERTALNFLQHLSGIATETSRYVAAVKGLNVKILDTRKTTPSLRTLEKYAVKCGGGKNHRTDLSDGILIKDNHLAVLNIHNQSLKDIVTKARKNAGKGKAVEVEVRNISEAREAAEAGADVVMLDNMTPREMRKAVKDLKGKCLIEASGGVNICNVRKVAETGVDYISVGALTHSARALDLSLELETD